MFCCTRQRMDGSDTLSADASHSSVELKTDRFGISGLAASELRKRLLHAKSLVNSCSTCKDAVVNVIKPLTKTTSYIDFIIATQCDRRNELVGKATVFVSHAWSADVIGLLETIVAKSKSMDQSTTFFWLDICSNNQHAIDQASGNSDMGWEWWTTSFKNTIEQTGRMLVVLAPYDDPIVCKRAWCLFEAVVTYNVCTWYVRVGKGIINFRTHGDIAQVKPTAKCNFVESSSSVLFCQYFRCIMCLI